MRGPNLIFFYMFCKDVRVWDFNTAYLTQPLILEALEASRCRGAPLCASHDAAPVTDVDAVLIYVQNKERVEISVSSGPQTVAYRRHLSPWGAAVGARPGSEWAGGLGRRGGRRCFPAPGRCPRSGPRCSASPAHPPSEPSAAAMSSGASVNALQRLVEQLKLEAGVERIKVRRAGTPFLGARKPPAPAPPAVPGPQGGRPAAAGGWLLSGAGGAQRDRGARLLERPRGVARRCGSDAVGGEEDGAPGPGSLLGLAGPRRPWGGDVA